MNHWLGAFVHLLPWYSDDQYTVEGFRQTFWGVVAFTIGSLVVAPLIQAEFLRNKKEGTVPKIDQTRQSRLPETYMF